MIKRAGGQYTFIMEAYGDIPAFLFKWTDTIIRQPCGNATQALTFATYAIGPFYPGCNPPITILKLTAATCLCTYTVLLTVLN